MMPAMPAWICATCGVQQAESETPPAICAICDDERQYVPQQGQRWTTLEELTGKGHRCDVRTVEPDLLGIGVEPSVAIGQRALLVRSGGAGLLWDLPGYIDADAVAQARDFCEVRAIAASHPHFYALMGEWSSALGDVPVLIPEADSRWVQRRSAPIQTWSGRREVFTGVTLLQCGGHFPGSAVVHWAAGAGGRGAILTGDTVGVVADRRFVTFMRSYPNEIPLGAPQVESITSVLDGVDFDRIYGGWWGSSVATGAKAAVARSKERYLHWISGAGEDA
jgi:glyoxylase-like metal-dependent hydrolase (beta-lactamase superfamily II)